MSTPIPIAADAGAPPCSPPDFAPHKPGIVLPAHSCDCHAHILGPVSRYAYSRDRIYTPPDCLFTDYRAMLTVLGVERAVLVQPSVYAHRQHRVAPGAARVAAPAFRGVAVVDWMSATEIESMHAAGIRGVRVNVVDVKEGKGRLPIERLRASPDASRPWLAHGIADSCR